MSDAAASTVDPDHATLPTGSCADIRLSVKRELDKWKANPREFERAWAIGPYPYRPQEGSAFVDWETYWLMWRHPDHGIVEALGHGRANVPTALRNTRLTEYQRSLGQDNMLRVTTQSWISDKSDFDLVEYPDDDSDDHPHENRSTTRCLLTFQILHWASGNATPKEEARRLRDAPIIFLEKTGSDTWAVTQLEWIAL